MEFYGVLRIERGIQAKFRMIAMTGFSRILRDAVDRRSYNRLPPEESHAKDLVYGNAKTLPNMG
jgi:hypothetical protein